MRATNLLTDYLLTAGVMSYFSGERHIGRGRMAVRAVPMFQGIRITAALAASVIAMTPTLANEPDDVQTVEVTGQRCTAWNAAYLPGCGGDLLTDRWTQPYQDNPILRMFEHYLRSFKYAEPQAFSGAGSRPSDQAQSSNPQDSGTLSGNPARHMDRMEVVRSGTC